MNNSHTQYKLPQSRFGLGSDHSDMIVMLIKYFRIVSMVFLVWLIGNLNFSIAWILIAVFLYLLRERNNSARVIKSEMIKAIGINEKDAILARLEDVPSWVFFPDKERTEWVNKFFKRIWPNFRDYLSNILKNSLEPIINEYSSTFIGTVHFERIDLGDIPPRIASIKVYTENIRPDEIMLDVEVLYAGDAKIKLESKTITAGVKDIQFHADIRFILKPICNQIPFFATMTLFFLKMPKIDFNLTDVANTFDLPGLRKLIDNTISDAISKTLVLPNRLVIPVIPDFDISELDSLKSVKPRGVFRVNVKKGINLKNADIGLLGKGKSDPYVKLSGIGIPKLTKVIDNDLNPVWNENFNFMIDNVNPDPTLFLEVFDKDEFNDDPIGTLNINIERIIKKGAEEGSYKLRDVERGEIYLKLEWFFLTSKREDLDKIRQHKSFKYQQATCLLMIDLKSASDLPYSFKNGTTLEPNPRAILSIREEKSSSATKQNTTNPRWNENHHFFIENPEDERLFVKIEDEKTAHQICNCEFALKEILHEEFLFIERTFVLNSMNPGYEPKLNMKMSLYILYPSKQDPNKVKEQNSNLLSPNDPNRVSETLSLRSSVSKNSINTSAYAHDSSRNFNGQIRLGMKYRIAEGTFLLIVYQCRNLCMVHKSNLPDPYVKVQLLPDKKTRKKTRYSKDTIDPVYEERFQWSIPIAELKRKQLCVTVKNHKFILANEKGFMGQIIIDLSTIEDDRMYEEWYELKNKNEAKYLLDYAETLIDKFVPI